MNTFFGKRQWGQVVLERTKTLVEPSFCSVLLCFISLSPSALRSWNHHLFQSKEFKAQVGGGAGIQTQVGLHSEALVSSSVRPVRGNKSKSAQLCQNLWSLAWFPFFPLHHSLGATQMAPLQFPQQFSFGRKLLRQPLPVFFTSKGWA